VAGATGSPVLDGEGRHVGSLEDLVVCWDTGDPHPPLHGIVVRAHLKHGYVPADEIAALDAATLRLTGAFAPHPVQRRHGLVALAHDVLDRQIVDVAGTDITRVSDLVLGRSPDGLRLVGADVSARTLLRRLGPRSLRRKVAAGRVDDWASVAAFSVRGAGEAGSVLALTGAATVLRALHPDELAALLGDLPHRERGQLTAGLESETGR